MTAEFPEGLTCPHCRGVEFEVGFVDDVLQGRVRWLAGWFEAGMLGNAKGRGSRRQRVLTAFRCTGCSRVELFAGP